MDNYIAHESAVIDSNCKIGVGTRIWHFSHIMPDCTLGENCNIGQNVVISPEVILGKNVKVQNVNQRKKEVQIQNGALSVWVSPETLRYPSGVKVPINRVSINIQRTVRGDIEVDCRGMRLEEFQKTAMDSIEEVISGEIPFVTIIHGHGDGVLKNWLRTYLKKEHRDLRWENIEGNDGCTKIYF